MNLTSPPSTGSASEISVRDHFSFSGPTVLHGEFSKSLKCTGFDVATFHTLMKERI